MHGPEYHSIVPAVLVAAFQNLSEKDRTLIREAIKRKIAGGIVDIMVFVQHVWELALHFQLLIMLHPCL